MEHLPDAPYRLFSCNLLFYISHDSFDRLLHQGDIQPVPDLHPPAGGGLEFCFQRVCEVLHLSRTWGRFIAFLEECTGTDTGL